MPICIRQLLKYIFVYYTQSVPQQKMCPHSPNMVLQAMADWYTQGDVPDQSRLPRILDVAQDPKVRTLIVRIPTYIVMHASYQDSTMCGVFCWSQLNLIFGDIKHRSLPRHLMPTSSPLSWTWQQRGSSLSLTSGSLTRLRTTR